jgi:hypothetical protein
VKRYRRVPVEVEATQLPPLSADGGADTWQEIAPSLPPPGGLPQPLLRIRNEFTAGSGQRETRLELATSSLEGMCLEAYSDPPESGV